MDVFPPWSWVVFSHSRYWQWYLLDTQNGSPGLSSCAALSPFYPYLLYSILWIRAWNLGLLILSVLSSQFQRLPTSNWILPALQSGKSLITLSWGQWVGLFHLLPVSLGLFSFVVWCPWSWNPLFYIYIKQAVTPSWPEVKLSYCFKF